MDDFSRVKKNSELYQKLHSDTDINLDTDRLTKYFERLNRIDDEITDNMKLESTSINPLHARKISDLDKRTDENVSVSFNNEYLDEFISEVKQYNIKKGLRVSEDTQTNIIQNFNSKINNDQNGLNHNDIELNSNKENDQTFITTQLEKLVDDEALDPINENIQNLQSTDIEDQANLLIETQKLRKLVEEHDSEIDQVNDHVSNTNRILNFVLAILFLTLLLALGGLIYFLLTNRGLL
ncbi:MAG: hypothetical protein PHP11_00115 [Erysipelotrichaceae bacterium]|nr:hypothetical protein [Erysipelotrichaceae bacterium]